MNFCLIRCVFLIARWHVCLRPSRGCDTNCFGTHAIYILFRTVASDFVLSLCDRVRKLENSIDFRTLLSAVFAVPCIVLPKTGKGG